MSPLVMEDLIVVFYWDQLGSGPAYTEEIPDISIPLNQIVEYGLAAVFVIFCAFDFLGETLEHHEHYNLF